MKSAGKTLPKWSDANEISQQIPLHRQTTRPTSAVTTVSIFTQWDRKEIRLSASLWSEHGAKGALLTLNGNFDRWRDGLLSNPVTIYCWNNQIMKQILSLPCLKKTCSSHEIYWALLKETLIFYDTWLDEVYELKKSRSSTLVTHCTYTSTSSEVLRTEGLWTAYYKLHHIMVDHITNN